MMCGTTWWLGHCREVSPNMHVKSNGGLFGAFINTLMGW